MIVELLLFILTTLIGYYLYIYKKIHNYFAGREVKYSPGVPMFGNVYNSTFLKKHVLEDIDAVYKAFPGERYVGFVDGIKPVLLVRDPELIKLIAVKDFQHFEVRKPFQPVEVAPGLSYSFIMMEVANWRESRHKLGSAFTASKMKQLTPLINEVCDNMLNYLKGHQSEDLEMMDLMRRYVNDVNVSTILGMQMNSTEDSDNIFLQISRENMNFTVKKRIVSFLAFQFSTAAKVLKFLDMVVLPISVSEFFRHTVTKIIKNRDMNCITRPDYIHLLLKNSKENDVDKEVTSGSKRNGNVSNVKNSSRPLKPYKEWTLDAIAGLAYVSFLGGFDPTASTLTMCIHELAIHPEVQEKLYQEIRISQEKTGEITYDDISKLKYLDCVLNETFRKWSGAMIYRICSKAYVLPPPREGGKPYKVNPGDMIYCVVNPLHRDPQYHPDPEVFDPERFSDENKSKMTPNTFMPFGMGPRSCVGLRFSIYNMKLILYHLVLKLKIVQSARTTTPIRLMANMFYMRSIGGTWVQFVNRNN